MLLRQRNGDSDNDCGCDGDGGGGDDGDDDDGECGERTYVCSFARLARSAGESRAKRARGGGRNGSIKCESARRDGDGDGEATLKRTAAKVI